MKAMFLQFHAGYGVSFYTILLTTFLDAYIIKISFMLSNEPFITDRKLVQSTHML